MDTHTHPPFKENVYQLLLYRQKVSSSCQRKRLNIALNGIVLFCPNCTAVHSSSESSLPHFIINQLLSNLWEKNRRKNSYLFYSVTFFWGSWARAQKRMYQNYTNSFLICLHSGWKKKNLKKKNPIANPCCVTREWFKSVTSLPHTHLWHACSKILMPNSQHC